MTNNCLNSQTLRKSQTWAEVIQKFSPRGICLSSVSPLPEVINIIPQVLEVLVLGLTPISPGPCPFSPYTPQPIPPQRPSPTLLSPQTFSPPHPVGVARFLARVFRDRQTFTFIYEDRRTWPPLTPPPIRTVLIFAPPLCAEKTDLSPVLVSL